MTAHESIAPVALQASEELLSRLNGARAVVVATEDGFAVACASHVDLDAGRLSAITSSMSAIGEAVSIETGIGMVRSLMVEADGGYLVMRATRRDGIGLVVAALVGRETMLGLVAHGVGEMARGLAS